LPPGILFPYAAHPYMVGRASPASSIGGNMKKMILAAAGALAVTAAMALPLSAGVASAAVIPHTALHTAASVSKQAVKCSAPDRASATVSVGSPDVRASGSWDKEKAKLVFALSAAPSFGMRLVFDGAVTCKATLPTEKFPIADTGLILKLTPKMSFAVKGKVGADFTWHPSIKMGFTVDSAGFSEGEHSFVNGAGVVFRGSGTVKVTLDLHAVIETVGGAVGVEGDLSPAITGNVTGTTATGAVCWKGSAAADAKFDTFVDAFGFKKKFLSRTWELGRHDLSAAECGLASSYSTTYDNLTYGIISTGSLTKMSATDAGAVSGELTVNPPLYGTSSLSGKLKGDKITFTTGAGGDFTGTVSEPSGDISGTYVFPVDGQNGTWTAKPEAAA
jgi:hypothetical protein